MEKVGQLESTPKIRLKCSHPYASFEWGACDNGWNYNLQSNVHNHSNQVIFKHKSKWHSVLNHNKYEIMLKQWLEKRKKKKEDNWDDEYGKWKVYCLKEKARQIIQGILHVVCELHSHVSSHGFLYHLENFVIQDKDLIIGDNYKKSTLLYVGAFLWSPSITKSLSWIAKFSGWYKNPWEEPWEWNSQTAWSMPCIVCLASSSGDIPSIFHIHHLNYFPFSFSLFSSPTTISPSSLIYYNWEQSFRSMSGNNIIVVAMHIRLQIIISSIIKSPWFKW